MKSRDYFNSLIKAENEKGIPSSRVVLGKKGHKGIKTAANMAKAVSPKEVPFPCLLDLLTPTNLLAFSGYRATC